MAGVKKGNEYASALGTLYTAPKAVLAAIAYSLARIDAEENHDAAIAVLVNEWRILHANGIVPQPAPNTYTSAPLDEEGAR